MSAAEPADDEPPAELGTPEGRRDRRAAVEPAGRRRRPRAAAEDQPGRGGRRRRGDRRRRGPGGALHAQGRQPARHRGDVALHLRAGPLGADRADDRPGVRRPRRCRIRRSAGGPGSRSGCGRPGGSTTRTRGCWTTTWPGCRSGRTCWTSRRRSTPRVYAAGFTGARERGVTNLIRWQLLGAARSHDRRRGRGTAHRSLRRGVLGVPLQLLDDLLRRRRDFPTMAAVWESGGFDDPAGYDFDRMITRLLDGIERLADRRRAVVSSAGASLNGLARVPRPKMQRKYSSPSACGPSVWTSQSSRWSLRRSIWLATLAGAQLLDQVVVLQRRLPRDGVAQVARRRRSGRCAVWSQSASTPASRPIAVDPDRPPALGSRGAVRVGAERLGAVDKAGRHCVGLVLAVSARRGVDSADVDWPRGDSSGAASADSRAARSVVDCDGAPVVAIGRTQHQEGRHQPDDQQERPAAPRQARTDGADGGSGRLRRSRHWHRPVVDLRRSASHRRTVPGRGRGGGGERSQLEGPSAGPGTAPPSDGPSVRRPGRPSAGP